VKLNTETLKDEVTRRGWGWSQDRDGWCISARGATATCISTKGPLSPEAIPTDDHPRLYVGGTIDAVVELVRIIAACGE